MVTACWRNVGAGRRFPLVSARRLCFRQGPERWRSQKVWPRRGRMSQMLCKLLRDVQLERTLAWAGPTPDRSSRRVFRMVSAIVPSHRAERSFGFPARSRRAVERRTEIATWHFENARLKIDGPIIRSVRDAGNLMDRPDDRSVIRLLVVTIVAPMVISVAPSKVDADARSITADPAAMAVAVMPPTATIADLFGQRGTCCTLNSLQGRCRCRRCGGGEHGASKQTCA